MKEIISRFIKGSKNWGIIFILFIVCSVIINDTFYQYNNVDNYVINNNNLSKAISTSDLTILELIEEEVVLSTFSGTMSAYGADCNGCSGFVGCSPYPYVGDGNIYYNDPTYGTLRIVAADRSVPCGSVMKIESSKLNEVIYAIVLDRGSSVGFDNKVQLDLLMYYYSDMISFGLDYNMSAQILRYGW